MKTGSREMQFELPQRLSATGIIGLAALSATHWLRENVSDPGPVLSFVLGVMPNLAAAFAMPLILAGFKPRTSDAPMTKVSRFCLLLGSLIYDIGPVRMGANTNAKRSICV